MREMLVFRTLKPGVNVGGDGTDAHGMSKCCNKQIALGRKKRNCQLHRLDDKVWKRICPFNAFKCIVIFRRTTVRKAFFILFMDLLSSSFSLFMIL